MLDRRRFLKSIIAAAATPSLLSGTVLAGPAKARPARLRRDPNGILDLVDGLEYSVVSRHGTTMSDGLVVPGAHDGMAAFPGRGGRAIVICNHELDGNYLPYSAFGRDYPAIPEDMQARVYDLGGGITPGLGGTTTTVWNPATRQTERQFLSLAGTEINCAGGATPWGTWLSCEENFANAGEALTFRGRFVREQDHGYVFEVPASATGLVDPRPIKAMGRFEHEACAVDPRTGIVYMTEDQHHSLFYRFIPDVPGRLHEGGRLQALAVIGDSALPTHNWTADHEVPLRSPLDVHWIDLDNVDRQDDDLREHGAEHGAAMFARGEGLCWAGDRAAFTCTIGGPARRGQVFTYMPGPDENRDGKSSGPGKLELIAESGEGSLLTNADNLTMAPWGDLIVCEDTLDDSSSSIIGIRPDGSQYLIADNAYSDSELAGVCFSPDGETMFFNIQYPGMTLAITGDWKTSVV